MSFFRPLWRFLRGVKSLGGGLYPEGALFPDFELRDVAGRVFRLEEIREPAILWFTNLCEDCRARAPLLDEAAAAGLRVLAVSILAFENPLPREFARSCSFPILLDPDDVVSRCLGLAHPPGTCPLHNLYVLDASQRVVFRHHLSAVDPERFRAVWGRWVKK